MAREILYMGQQPIDHPSPYPAVHAPIFPLSTSPSGIHLLFTSQLSIHHCSICPSVQPSSCPYPAVPHYVYIYDCQLLLADSLVESSASLSLDLLIDHEDHYYRSSTQNPNTSTSKCCHVLTTISSKNYLNPSTCLWPPKQ